MAAAAVELAPPGLPDALALMARARGENFPVALRLLAPAERRALLAVYGFARLADELGDELGGDRLAALDWLEREIDRAYRARCAGGVSEIAKQTTQAQPAAAQDQRSAPGAGAAGLLSALREVLAERELP
ncbi:MAG TPA: squalene/phytoene synthase family protein, partial [Solirubrobacteraceae bacterium]|nr:squalene/phytoene synthase family protein [Solirubrobacteraceae bacterium]